MTDIEKLLEEVRELKRKTEELDTQVYTLKAAIKSFCALDNLSDEPTQAWELRDLLANWASFEIPDEEPKPTRQEKEYVAREMDKCFGTCKRSDE